MGKAFMGSPSRSALIALGVALCAVVGATAYGQIQLNAWNGPFYDSLSQKNFSSFLYQLVAFAVIAGSLLVLNVAQTWLNQTTKMKLREGLTRDLIDQWLEPNRAFRLAGSGEIGVNPDQRVHEDVRHLTELSTDLGIGLLQATLLLASFIGVLWILSRGIVVKLDGWTFSIPGYMVWCALIYASTASWLSWHVGRPLIRLNAERYAREADLRVALVRVNEHANGIAIHSGEKDEKDYLRRELDQVIAMMRRLVTAATRLAWVTAGYGWFAIVAPFVVAAPGFFSGDLSLGGLMVAVGAFNQVQQALRWFIDNFGVIADWRATLLRVASFRQALVEMDKLGHQTGQIERVEASDGKLTFENLGVASPAGCTGLSEPHISIAPGEHVLIVGAPKVGKTNLFRAIAGLWPWGLLPAQPLDRNRFLFGQGMFGRTGQNERFPPKGHDLQGVGAFWKGDQAQIRGVAQHLFVNLPGAAALNPHLHARVVLLEAFDLRRQIVKPNALDRRDADAPRQHPMDFLHSRLHGLVVPKNPFAEIVKNLPHAGEPVTILAPLDEPRAGAPFQRGDRLADGGLRDPAEFGGSAKTPGLDQVAEDLSDSRSAWLIQPRGAGCVKTRLVFAHPS